MRIQTRCNSDNYALLCRRQLAALDAQRVRTEPMRPDAGEAERKCPRSAHQKLLKRLRARRMRSQRREHQTAKRRVLIAPLKTWRLVREQLERMRELWLPAAESVRRQCSREVLGYETQANSSLSEATVAVVGYMTAAAGAGVLKSGARTAAGEETTTVVWCDGSDGGGMSDAGVRNELHLRIQSRGNPENYMLLCRRKLAELDATVVPVTNVVV